MKNPQAKTFEEVTDFWRFGKWDTPIKEHRLWKLTDKPYVINNSLLPINRQNFVDNVTYRKYNYPKHTLPIFRSSDIYTGWLPFQDGYAFVEFTDQYPTLIKFEDDDRKPIATTEFTQEDVVKYAFHNLLNNKPTPNLKDFEHLLQYKHAAFDDNFINYDFNKKEFYLDTNKVSLIAQNNPINIDNETALVNSINQWLNAINHGQCQHLITPLKVIATGPLTSFKTLKFTFEPKIYQKVKYNSFVGDLVRGDSINVTHFPPGDGRIGDYYVYGSINGKFHGYEFQDNKTTYKKDWVSVPISSLLMKDKY